MALTTADIITEVLDAMNESTSSTVMRAKAQKWVNDAYDSISGRENLAFGRVNSTVAIGDGTAAYDFPDGMKGILAVWNVTKNEPLEIITPEEYHREYPDPTDTTEAEPEKCCIEYNSTTKCYQIRTIPIPDASYTLGYSGFTWATDLTESGTVVNPIETNMRLALKYGAIYYGRISMNEELGVIDRAEREFEKCVLMVLKGSRNFHAGRRRMKFCLKAGDY